MPTYDWNTLNDSCKKCGDKDWFADKNCDESKVDNIKRDVSTILKGDIQTKSHQVVITTRETEICKSS